MYPDGCIGWWVFGHLFPTSPQLLEAVTSQSVSDEAITQTMGRCWQENQYLLCPHSAVAVSCHYQQVDRQQPRYWWGGRLSFREGGPLWTSLGPSFSPSRGHRNVNNLLFLGGGVPHMACEILVPRLGIELRLSAVEAQSLDHWSTREVPQMGFMSIVGAE